MAHSLFDLQKDLARTAKKIGNMPKENAKRMAQRTQTEMIRLQRKDFKQFDRRQVKIKGPTQRGPKAWATIAGGGLAVISEWGSYRNPNGWMIYPRAYTKATLMHGKTYMGKQRIEDTRRKVAAGEKVRGNLRRDVHRIQAMVLAFGQSGWKVHDGKAFRRFSKHKGIRPHSFVERASARAQEQSGEIVAQQVIGVMGTLR